MKTSLQILFLGLAITVVSFDYGCNLMTGPGDSQKNLDLTTTDKVVASASSSFGLNLFGNVVAQEAGKNFFISPLSVSMALAMTLNGAAGQTYADMQKTLGLQGLSNGEIDKSYEDLIAQFAALDPSVTFRIANSIWYRNTFPVIDSFLTVNSTYFDAAVKPLDFNAADAADVINQWVSGKTGGKIPSIISPPIDHTAMLYLINALYFNGIWMYAFDPANTEPRPFHLLDSSVVNVPTMAVGDTLNYYSDNLFRVVELPYGKGDYSMLVLLPKPTFAAAEASLNQNEVDGIINGLAPRDVNVLLPKFKLTYETSLIPILKKMGMGIAFGGGADFSRINASVPLEITEVLHKAYVDVNEKGTEAAAVTVVGIGLTAVEPVPINFTVDKPFIFLIKENHDNTIMFMGAVVNPTLTS